MLATLRHPHIATLIDAGVSPEGELYLAMPYIESEWLDGYANREKLGVAARLNLFLQVCDAVDFAHRQLILHRDLKPSNILVDRRGEAHLVDFGTAALIGGQATNPGSRSLTPRYASPEQLRGERTGVAGDVFTLGVVLYELMTGAWPFGDPDSILSGMRRATGQSAATAPATAVTEAAAAKRSMSADRLRRELAGDLSAVVLKALEFDPARRYASVREFADDIERCRRREPVRARRATWSYRARRFLRRHAVAAVLVSGAAIGLAATAVVAVREARMARLEATRSDAVNRFLSGMLSTFAEGAFDADKYTVREMLDRAAKELDKGAESDPAAEATLRRSLAQSYNGLHRLADARRQIDRAIAIAERGAATRESVACLVVAAQIAQNSGASADAIGLLDRASRQLGELGTRADLDEVLWVDFNLGTLLSWYRPGEREKAKRLLNEGVAIGMRNPSLPRAIVARTLAQIGYVEGQEGRYADAEKTLLRALEIGRPGGGGDWERVVYQSLTDARGKAGDAAGARRYAEAWVEAAARSSGPDGIDAQLARLEWARYAASTGQAGEAERTVDAAMVRIEADAPPLLLWRAGKSASAAMLACGKADKAERYARAGLAGAGKARLAAADPRLGDSWVSLADALSQEGRSAEAADALTRAGEIYTNAGPEWKAKAAEVGARMARLPPTQ